MSGGVEYDFDTLSFEPVRVRVILNPKCTKNSVKKELESAFLWCRTPQGDQFWCNQFDAGKLTSEARDALEDMLKAWEAWKAATPTSETKPTNPKDGLGIRKWRQFSCVPWSVIAEIGVGMLEGARKYGPFNWRPAGARASVYVDAAIGHIMQWQEGEDIDSDSGLSHIAKAITSLVVLRDAMLQGVLLDDRPPAARLDALRSDLQQRVERIVPVEGEAQASTFQQPPFEERVSVFKGKTIVFTGAFLLMTRAEAKARAEALGAKVERSISRRTDYVVVGIGAGTKLSSAIEYGISVLNEAAWLALSASDARFQ